MANGFTHFIYNILHEQYIIMRHSIFLMNPIGSVEKTWGRFLNEAYLRCTYLRGRLHVLAGTDAK